MTSTETKTAPATAKAEEKKTEAVAEKPAGYQPEADSTPDQKDAAKKSGRVVLDLSDNACYCGCKGACSGRFQPGHDAKLRGKLTRAALAGVGLTIVMGKDRRDTTPRRFAEILTTPKHDWAKALDAAVEAGKKAAKDADARRAESARKAAERKAANPAKSKITLDDFAK